MHQHLSVVREQESNLGSVRPYFLHTSLTDVDTARPPDTGPATVHGSVTVRVQRD
jgi:hypothetical protein